jgi:hypothetical protein
LSSSALSASSSSSARFLLQAVALALFLVAASLHLPLIRRVAGCHDDAHLGRLGRRRVPTGAGTGKP